MKRKEIKKFKHDCDTCVYLGTFTDIKAYTYDLYFCKKEPTIIARFGDEGPEYSSGLFFKDKMESLAVAHTLAVRRGLIEEENKSKTIEKLVKIKRKIE